MDIQGLPWIGKGIFGNPMFPWYDGFPQKHRIPTEINYFLCCFVQLRGACGGRQEASLATCPLVRHVGLRYCSNVCAFHDGEVSGALQRILTLAAGVESHLSRSEVWQSDFP